MSFLRKHWLGITITLGVLAVAAAVALVVVFPPAALVPVIATVAAALTSPPAILTYMALGAVAAVGLAFLVKLFVVRQLHRLKNHDPCAVVAANPNLGSTDETIYSSSLFESSGPIHQEGQAWGETSDAWAQLGENTALMINPGDDVNYSPLIKTVKFAEAVKIVNADVDVDCARNSEEGQDSPSPC